MPSESRCRKLEARARRNPAGLRFRELVSLLQCAGFEHVRTRGSHRSFRNAAGAVVVVQRGANGEAKPYQVRQVLRYL